MKLTALNEYHSTPISEKLTSNFIELAFGHQELGLGAEMFFNRSFERFTPYRLIYKVCSYMLEDEENIGSRYEPDWRKLEWYHTGYEHNAWFAFPGTAGNQEIRDDSTFVIEDSPTADVHIALVDDNTHGLSAMRVTNNGAAAGGLAQDGKYCVPGVNYIFTGKIRRISGAGKLNAAFFREGTTEEPVCLSALDPDIGSGYKTVRAVLTVPETGRYTFALLTPPGSEYVCDDFSLVPDDAVHGFRKAAVEAGKYISPRVMRWPGGCFASFYDWREGVGKDRIPGSSAFWGGFQYNDIGTDELASYAEDIGGESMICVNMYHPFKRFSELIPADKLDTADPDDRENIPFPHGRDMRQFTDRERGALDAAAWVEYCNGDQSTEGGKARALNGREKPYNVKYWELDNEVHRWFRCEEYAEQCVMYSKAMKAVDPSIKIGMVSYGYGYDGLERMLEIAGDHIDFLADRGIDEPDIAYKIDLLNRFNASRGTDIRYCNTEWVPLNGADLYNMVPKEERTINRLMIFSKWSYALETASNLMTWQRHGQMVGFVCFSAYADNHSQAVMETAKEGIFMAPSGVMLHQFANTKAYRTIRIKDYLPKRTDPVQVQLSEDESGEYLVLNVLNRSEERDSLELDLSAAGAADGAHGGKLLWADSLLSTITLDENGIKESTAEVTVKGGVLFADVPPASFAEYLIKK